MHYCYILRFICHMQFNMNTSKWMLQSYQRNTSTSCFPRHRNSWSANLCVKGFKVKITYIETLPHDDIPVPSSPVILVHHVLDYLCTLETWYCKWNCYGYTDCFYTLPWNSLNIFPGYCCKFREQTSSPMWMLKILTTNNNVW